MNATAPVDRLRLLFDWAHADVRRLTGWVFVAVLLHLVAWLLFQIRYPHPEPARISDASLYVLLPGSPEARRLAPFLASADPALVAPEQSDRLGLPTAHIPDYQPSYAVAAPQLVPLPDPPTRLLPPLVRDFGPVPMTDRPAPAPPLPAPASASQVLFSDSLQKRAPRDLPKAKFKARPGDLLEPTRFLIGVAPDGRVLHVLRDGGAVSEPLEDAAAKLLMRTWFTRGPDSRLAWGTATFYWGLDVKREEVKPTDP